MNKKGQYVILIPGSLELKDSRLVNAVVYASVILMLFVLLDVGLILGGEFIGLPNLYLDIVDYWFVFIGLVIIGGLYGAATYKKPRKRSKRK